MSDAAGAGGREPPSQEEKTSDSPAAGVDRDKNSPAAVPDETKGARIAPGRPSKEPKRPTRTDGSDTVASDDDRDYSVPSKITVKLGKVTGLLIAAAGLVGAVTKLVEEIVKALGH